MELYADLVTEYLDFATYAAGVSPTFEAWARGVAEDEEVLAWLGALPPIKQQPNLVFAAARWHGVPAPGPYASLRGALLGDDGTIRATVLERATQTNEAGRSATLLPAFAQVAAGRPLALLEVGASAGLCLVPDRWRYAWERPDGEVVRVGDPSLPELRCRAEGPVPFPEKVPEVVWRGGIDLNPLDVTSEDQMRWLETLVWPEHDDRRARLRQAVGIVRRDPPPIVAGDLIVELPGTIDRIRTEVPGTPVVVFHSAVIAYLEDPDRRRFAAMMAELVAAGLCHWVSNEGRRVLPEVTRDLQVPSGRFVLGLDGDPVAYTDGHGRALTWL